MALNKFFTPALLIALAAAQSVPVAAIDTATISAQAWASVPSCSRYMAIGYCVWMTCTPVGCSTATSIKYANYNPDAVVSVYHNTGENPWVEMRVLGALTEEAMESIADSTLRAISSVLGVETFDLDFEGGNQGESKRVEGENLVFKEAEIFGHPWQLNTASNPTFGGFVCPTATQSFMPYYQSIVDVLAWRYPEYAQIADPAGAGAALFMPIYREIGRGTPILGFGNTWGSVYPRSGFLYANEPAKAAAVIAQRAADIATRYSQVPHIYYPMPNGGTTMIAGMHVWLPPPILEASPDTGTWQMLSPTLDGSCTEFGINDTFDLWSWADFKNTPPGAGTGEDFVWALWRPYKCCMRRGHFIVEERDMIRWPAF